MKSIFALVGVLVACLLAYGWFTGTAVGVNFDKSNCAGATYLGKSVQVCTGTDANGHKTVTVK